MYLGKFAFVVLLLVGLFLPASSRVEAQVNTVNLSGTVFDPQQLAVKEAKITAEEYCEWRRARSDQRLKRALRDYRNPSRNLFADSRGTGFGSLEGRIAEARARHDSRIQPPFATQDDERDDQRGGCARSRGNNKD